MTATRKADFDVWARAGTAKAQAAAADRMTNVRRLWMVTLLSPHEQSGSGAVCWHRDTIIVRDKPVASVVIFRQVLGGQQPCRRLHPTPTTDAQQGAQLGRIPFTRTSRLRHLHPPPGSYASISDALSNAFQHGVFLQNSRKKYFQQWQLSIPASVSAALSLRE